MRNCVVRVVLVVGAVCLVAGATMVAIQRWQDRPQRFTLLERRLPTGDTIRVGYIARPHWLVSWCPAGLYARREQWYLYLLTWERGGRQRTYRLGDWWGDSRPFELRARTDWQGVWLVDRTTQRADIFASLDLTTGECMDVNEMPTDSRGDIPIQHPSSEHRPKWATPDGGVLLGQCPRDPGRSQ